MRKRYRWSNRHVRSRIEDKVFLDTRFALNTRTWFIDTGISESVILHAYQAIGSGLPRRGDSPQRQLKPA